MAESLTICPSCGSSVQTTAKFCPRCGTGLQLRLPQISSIPTEALPSKLPIHLGRYQVRGTWYVDDAIIQLTRAGSSQNYFALPLAKRLSNEHLKQLTRLGMVENSTIQNHFCAPVGQAANEHRQPYLIVQAPRGVRLDTVPIPMQGERAVDVYFQLVEIIDQLQKEGWVTALPALGQAKGWLRPLGKTPLSQWLGNMSDTMRRRFRTESLLRFQRCFTLDDSGIVQVFDYTGWERVPQDAQERAHRKNRDVILCTRTMQWLFSGKSLGRQIEELRASAGAVGELIFEVFDNLDLSPEMIGEMVYRKMPKKQTTRSRAVAVTTKLEQGQPTSKLVIHLDAAGATDPGKTRGENEDSLLVLPFGDTHDAGLFAVADGLGGHADGKMASELVIQTLEQSARGEWAQLQTLDAAQIQDRLLKWIEQANQRVLDTAYARNSNMGSTVTAALIFNQRAYIANVGDSRTYLWRNGQLEQITRDHSLVASLVAANLLTEDEIYTHPQRNQIFRSLGAEANLTIDPFQETFGVGDGLLLCSDGLWEMVRKPQLEETLKQGGDAASICQRLIALANNNGGEDNITAIFIQITL